MAGSNCGCSTPTTTSTASSRSWCSTARAGPSPPCCARPAGRAGAEARAFLRRLVREIRGHWPRVEILIRADSHYCAPEVLDFCRAERLDFILGVASTTTLRRHVEALEQQHRCPARRHAPATRQAAPLQGILRRRRQLEPGRAHHRPRRGRAAGHRHPLRRHQPRRRPARSALREDLYCARGQAENHIKAWKPHLAADRTSCCRATANQFRLLLHTGAYWLMWSLRSLMPQRSTWRVAQFDTLRLRLIKLAARVVALKTRVMLHLPSACPDQGHPAPRPRAPAAPDLLSIGADAPAEPFQPQPQAPRSAPEPTGPKTGAGTTRQHNQ